MQPAYIFSVCSVKQMRTYLNMCTTSNYQLPKISTHYKALKLNKGLAQVTAYPHPKKLPFSLALPTNWNLLPYNLQIHFLWENWNFLHSFKLNVHMDVKFF